jgi:hypothetical protein
MGIIGVSKIVINTFLYNESCKNMDKRTFIAHLGHEG